MTTEPQSDDMRSIGTVVLFSTVALSLYTALHGGGHPDMPRWLVSFAGITLFLLLLSRSRRPYNIPPARLTFSWAFFILWVGISSAFSADIDVSVGEFLMYLGLFALGFIAYSMPQDEREIKRFLIAMIASAGIVTIVGWVIYFIGRFSIDGGPAMVSHFVGTFYWKNPMAAFLILFFPLVIAFMIEHAGWKRWLSGILAVIMLGGLVLTRSRAGWISIVFATAVLFVPAYTSRIDRKKLIYTVSIIIIGIALGFAFSQKGEVSGRIASIGAMRTAELSEDRSAMERIAMLEAGLEMAGDFPVFGVGPRAWPSMRATYLHQLRTIPQFPHNAYLRALAETGIPGFALLCIALLITFVPMWKKCFHKSTSLIFAGITAGLTAVFVHMAVDFHAAFAGILVPCVLLFGIGNRILQSEKQDLRHISGRIPIIVLSLAIIIILLLRVASQTFYSSAVVSAQLGDVRGGEKEANIASAINPADWKPRMLLAHFALIDGDNDKAHILIESALKRAPVVPRLHNIKARIELANNDTASAIESIRKAISYAPRGNPEMYFELASIQILTDQTDEAEKTYIAAVDAMAPFVGGAYTSSTVGYRYRSSVAWESLGTIWLERGDSVMAEIALFNSEQLQKPRETDAVMRNLGFDTPSPEITVVRLFEAITESDTARVRELTATDDTALPKFAEGFTLSVEKILDVRMNPLGSQAEVDIVIKSITDEGNESVAKSMMLLILREGRWRVVFGKG